MKNELFLNAVNYYLRCDYCYWYCNSSTFLLNKYKEFKIIFDKIAFWNLYLMKFVLCNFTLLLKMEVQKFFKNNIYLFNQDVYG